MRNLVYWGQNTVEAFKTAVGVITVSKQRKEIKQSVRNWNKMCYSQICVHSHVDRMGQDRWASRAPTDPQEDRLKDGERAVRQRQKRTDTDEQQDRVLEEKKEKT
jgi:hypothetical protein